MRRPKGFNLPLIKCSLCDFATKNEYIYRRHKNRCSREHRKTVLGDTEVSFAEDMDPKTETDMDAFEGEQDATNVEQGEQEEQQDAGEVAMAMSPSSAGTSLPPPLVNRNYRCSQCTYATTKSKMFLYHQIDSHGAKINVFPCQFCEYATKYKHKVRRHIQFAHKEKLAEGRLIHGFEEGGVLGELEAAAESNKTSRKEKTAGSLFRKALSRVSSKSKAIKKKPLPQKTYPHIMRIKTSSGADMFKCKLCLYSGKNRHQAVKHVKACHTGAKTFSCWICPFKTKSKNDFYQHKSTHGASSAQYQCPECLYATDFKPNFDRHMENHKANKPFKCTICSYSTGHDGALKRHMTNHHPLTEKNESIVFGGEIVDTDGNDLDGTAGDSKEEDEMDEEEALDVDDEEYDPRAPEGVPGYPRRSGNRNSCELCGLSYKRLSDLGRHMKIKHNTSLREMKENPIQIENENSNDSFGEDSSWAKSQTSWKDKAKCKFCSYIAKWPSDLRRHMAVHSVEKRFKCPYCMKKYKYLGDLNVHVRRDHNREPEDIEVQRVAIVPLKKSSPQIFRCPACTFTTKWKSEMERHSHMHKEEKAYQCRKCDYQTYWRGDIGRHIFRHHADLMPKDTKDVNIKEFMIVRPERKAVKSRVHKALHLTESIDPDDSASVVIPEPMNTSVDDHESDSLSTTSSASPQKDVHGTPSKCNHCDFVTNAPSKLKAHIATHFNLKQFKCPICGRRSNWKWDVRKHMKKDHPESNADVQTLCLEEAKATIQDYLDTQPNVRREHHFNVQLAAKMEAQSGEVKMKKPYQCSLCPFRSDFRWSVSKHLRTIHNGQLGSIIFLKEKDKDKDPDGYVPSKAESQEKQSMAPPPPSNKHHDLRAPSKKNTFRQPVPSGDIDMDKPYMCVECGKRGAIKGDIKKHYHYIHPNKEVKLIYVPDGREFVYAGNTTPLLGDDTGSHNQQSSSGKETVDGKRTVYGENTKYSDPKTHGYCKPFKCSVCSRRSNWKWDVKKHLRDKHSGDGGYVIMLDLKTARDTYHAECSPQQGNPMREIRALEAKMQATETEAEVSGMNEDLDRCKRFKCGSCSYRSNWRTDIGRHIKRRHRHSKTKVILLDYKVAKETLSSYYYDRTSREPAASDASIGNLKKESYKKKSGTEMKKVWKCCKCPFEATVKSHIIRHMQKHNMKPFTCCLCSFSSNFRSALYRHLRCTHGKTDYPTYTKILIKYGKGFAGGSNGQTTLDDFGVAISALQQGKTIITEQYVDSYLCRICNFQSPKDYLAYRHIREKHGVEDKNQVLKIRKRQRMEVPAEQELQPLEDQMKEESPNERGKKYMCSICPYKATKRGLLNFHMTYHQPQAVNKYKCKYCPYYVCAPRLLHQHMRLHTNRKNWPKGQKSPNVTPKKKSTTPGIAVTPKKHKCPQCPYQSNSKNDMLYHKQFHRPKPTAEFKCEHCDYWVTHRRLLKQHMKIHEEYEQQLMLPPQLVLLQASPCKSEMSDASILFDAVEVASLKQRLIGSKITASLSTSPSVSPMKIATQCSVGTRPGYVMKNGSYKKLHRCQFCPYTNIRNRNVKLHEMMHGARKSDHPLMKCPHCDYYVGAKGLLSHHLKVHQQHYVPDFNDNLVADHAKQEGLGGYDDDDRSSDTTEIMQEHKVDTLLEIARFKKYCCEKCPYASAKRSHFERHSELHGSKQRFTCDFCDYSVPSNNLLAQHRKLHMMPNQNLLAAQSLINLQHLAHVPADVALASALPPIDTKEPITISVIHDHLDLYENAPPEAEFEPKKLYRCDRCPYANVRRDHLIAHLKFHMVRSDLACPYCDYSVSKQYLLSQHIRVHFCPLPELSDWLAQNGQTDRAQECKEPDISEAIEVAQKFHSGTQEIVARPKEEKADPEEEKALPRKEDSESDPIYQDTAASEDKEMDVEMKEDEPQPSTSKEESIVVTPVEPTPGPSSAKDPPNPYICQYCDREFTASETLVRHEMQHLIGNHFEVQAAPNENPTPQEEPEEKSKEPSNSASEEASDSTEIETKAEDTEIIEVTVEEIKEEPEEEEPPQEEISDEKVEEKEDVDDEEPMETVVHLAADVS
ncbi:zinc finger protein Xfin-like isoform X2 [Haliotis rufescens]|uniref:zinc finger protein Xfin-like isoform X2 n=1 Tax=Haliotis rufescens TaxID=6454 RepID=UPI00201F32BC|nr:zinc finger protein Xfin-like isoform X2 [Haliotis rufescens]